MDLTSLNVRSTFTFGEGRKAELGVIWAQEGIIALESLFEASSGSEGVLQIHFSSGTAIDKFEAFLIPVHVVRSDNSSLVLKLSREKLSKAQERQWKEMEVPSKSVEKGKAT
ncbi:MAG TPA: hypothetical protein VI895_09070 [Bdellovibrionota bacterium]|nr:hypothetical protein [Bdellovibrionota bacterium]